MKFDLLLKENIRKKTSRWIWNCLWVHLSRGILKWPIVCAGTCGDQTVMRNHLFSRAHSRDCVPPLSEISRIFIPKVESANSTMRGKRTALKICNYFCSYAANCLGKNNEKSHTSRSWFFFKRASPLNFPLPSTFKTRQSMMNRIWLTLEPLVKGELVQILSFTNKNNFLSLKRACAPRP